MQYFLWVSFASGNNKPLQEPKFAISVTSPVHTDQALFETTTCGGIIKS